MEAGPLSEHASFESPDSRLYKRETFAKNSSIYTLLYPPFLPLLFNMHRITKWLAVRRKELLSSNRLQLVVTQYHLSW